MAQTAKRLSKTVYLILNSLFFGAFVIVASSVPQLLRKGGEVAEADTVGGYTQSGYTSYSQSGYTSYGESSYYAQGSYCYNSKYCSYAQSGYGGDGDGGGDGGGGDGDGGCDDDGGDGGCDGY